MLGIPVIGGEREDEIGSCWKWDLGDQGSRLRLDGFKEWQDIILCRPAHNMMHRGMETEVLL